MNPNAFSFNTPSGTAAVMSGFTAIYFSFTTLMTVGYGDITPVADVARMLAMLEAMTGTLFVGGHDRPPGFPLLRLGATPHAGPH